MIIIILPMFNEEESIEVLRHSVQQNYLAPTRFVTVDDGSDDNTHCMLKRWQGCDDRVHIVSYSPNRGLPAACTAGFVAALELGAGSNHDDVLITMDADASHPMELIPKMTEKIRAGYDIVIASRHQPGASQQGLSLLRRIFSWGASTLMSVFYPVAGLRDYSTNYRAYRASLIREALEKSGGCLVEAKGFVGVVELLLRLCSLDPKITEVPLNLRYDLKKSESKMRVWKTVKGYLSLISQKKVKSKIGVCLPLLFRGKGRDN